MTTETADLHTEAPAVDPEGIQMTVAELFDRLSRPNNLFLIDVRNEDEFAAWQIEGRHTPETINVPYFAFFENEAESMAQVPRGREIVVVCAKGGASDFVAAMLEEEGIPAVNLAEGMIGWGNYHVIRPVVEAGNYQIYQVDRVARGCLSYILISQGQAAIIDPLRHTRQYLDFLAEKDARPVLIFDTHGHADHISGGPALAAETEAGYYLHPYDAIHPFDMLPARLDYQQLRDKQAFTLGDLQVEAVHVPGHTLGQVNFLVTADDGESFCFTGDNLFLQSFGRPDLGGQGETWAPLVYQAIFETLKERVPARAWILPGHYARPDEADEAGLFARRLSKVWEQNLDVSHTDQDAFIQHVLSHLPEMPEQYIEIKRINVGLSNADEEVASELELGKNICALSTAY